MKTKTVIVVGAGIFGVSAALELHRRGWEVQLLDPGPLPNPRGQSVGSRMMIRLEYRSDEAYMGLVEASLAGWREWNQTWTEPPFHETGLLVLQRTAPAAGEFEYESYQTLLKRGHHPTKLDGNGIRSRFPAWNVERYGHGYFNPEGGYVNGKQVLDQLLEQLRATQISLHEGQRFDHLVTSNARVEGVMTTEGKQFSGDRVVLAAGAWTPQLLPALAPAFRPNGLPTFQLRPERPEHFLPSVFPTFIADIANTGYFGYPLNEQDGLVVIGRQGRGRVVELDEASIASQAEIALMRLFLADTFPELFKAQLVATHFVPFREPWDGHLWIAADPEQLGLIVATGGDHAFKFAPILGALLADCAEGQQNPFLQKFCWRPDIRPADA